MINITKKEIEMSSDLITKLKWACGSNYKATNGSLRIVDHTNIAYVEPHKVIINNVLFLMFNEHEFVYVENLSNKIPLTKLKQYLRKI
jgi:hypothetical protein